MAVECLRRRWLVARLGIDRNGLLSSWAHQILWARRYAATAHAGTVDHLSWRTARAIQGNILSIRVGTLGMNWHDRPTTKAGDLGERIAKRMFEEKGYVVYTPDRFGGAHPVDIVAIQKNSLRVLVADSKAKPQRKRFPDTGINMVHWEKYRQLGRFHNLQVFLVFVDWESVQVYGQFLDVLEQRRKICHNGRDLIYPKTENYEHAEIRYWPISAMKQLHGLTSKESEELRQLSLRNDTYGGNSRQLDLLNMGGNVEGNDWPA